MEHPTKKDIDGLIEYIDGIDLNLLIKTKDEQHDLVLYTFESQSIVLNKKTKRILLDDAYLSWLLFTKLTKFTLKGVSIPNVEKVDLEILTKNLECLRNLWYSAVAKERYERTKEKTLVISIEDINRDFPMLFNPTQLQLISTKSRKDATNISAYLLLSSMVISYDYEHILNTIADKNL